MLVFEFILVQTIVFGVIFFVLRRMMVQNTTSAVNRLKLVDGENAARLEAVKKKIEEAEAEYKRRAAEFAQELEKQREEAKKQIEEEKDKVLGKAREEGERILEAAKARGQKVDQEIEKELQGRAVGLARGIVEEALGGTMKSSLNDRLVDEFLLEVEAMETGHVPEQIREVEIVIPHPLGPDRKKKIKEILEKKLGRKMEIRETVKSDMVGGIVLHFGSLVVDGSLDDLLVGIARNLKKQE